jgi:hypothetical protein
MKISRSRKALTDDARTNCLTTPLNQLSVRLLGKYELSETGYHQGVNDSQKDCGCYGHQHSSNQIFLHDGLLYASPTRVMSISISLIPMQGTMIPPAP